MPQGPIDYEQLAREHGGTKVTPAPAPTGPDYAALAREQGGTPAMNVAVVNGQRVPVEAGGVRGFLEEATPSINPVKINEALQQAFWHPLDTAKGMLAAQDVPRQEAMTAFEQGDPVTGVRKLIDWLIPVIGPRLDEAADYMQQGQTARGLGAATDVGLSIATPKIIGGVASRIPTREGLATTLERAGANRVTRVIAPQVGPQKIRFGTMAADVAPAVARKTTARTPGGLLDEVGEKAAAANQQLDAAYAAVPAGRPLWTHPIVQGLEAKIRELTVPSASGAGLTPATRAARVAALRKALDEAQLLGPTASLEDLRKLRMAWDDGAQAVFTPITADNFAAARSTGHGWADARTVLSEHMAARHPELRALNADASLWIKAQDVLQAAEEVERVRPRVGRSLLASAITAGVGSTAGGAVGAGMGALLGPVLERTLAAASPVAKLTAARSMIRLADAMRTGQRSAAHAAVLRLSAVLPAAERAAWLAQATRLMRDLDPAGTPAAAPAGAASSGRTPP